MAGLAGSSQYKAAKIGPELVTLIDQRNWGRESGVTPTTLYATAWGYCVGYLTEQDSRFRVSFPRLLVSIDWLYDEIISWNSVHTDQSYQLLTADVRPGQLLAIVLYALSTVSHKNPGLFSAVENSGAISAGG